ncbi:DUF2786 domain-containing protein [Specibacter cremeus]|uniref:DUF2786 domain-containing protein n=1 Tax=Specibacter cremeus TaxID=1629051 RepID=UPI000F78B97B|nr:DUF2786 domain-containing protein [Specibacter cremeus]
MHTTAKKAAKTLTLITRLLAKAEATGFPDEAQAFQEHAERLMVRYGIEQATVDAEAGRLGKPREAMVERHFPVTGTYRVGRSQGFTAIARAFNSVQVLESTGRTAKTLYLIGAESDVDQVMRLFHSLLVQMDGAMHAWWAAVPYRDALSANDRTLERRQFQLSFLHRVAERITALHASEAAAGEPGRALVLVGRRERAEEHVRTLHPRVRIVRPRGLLAGTHSAHAAGSAAGSRATVNERVGGHAFGQVKG